MSKTISAISKPASGAPNITHEHCHSGGGRKTEHKAQSSSGASRETTHVESSPLGKGTTAGEARQDPTFERGGVSTYERHEQFHGINEVDYFTPSEELRAQMEHENGHRFFEEDSATSAPTVIGAPARNPGDTPGALTVSKPGLQEAATMEGAETPHKEDGAIREKDLFGTNRDLNASPALLTAGNYDPVRIQPIETDSKIVDIAQGYLDTPYVWGGKNSGKDGGLDCSGFSSSVYEKAGLKEPCNARWFSDQTDPRINPKGCEYAGMKVTKEPVPGDAVVFGSQHVGIYMGKVNGEPVYISANHGGRNSTKEHPSGRVDIMKVSSHKVQPAVYFHYTKKD